MIPTFSKRSLVAASAVTVLAGASMPASALFVGTEQSGGLITQLYIDPGTPVGQFSPGPDTRTIAAGDLILGDVTGFVANSGTQLTVPTGSLPPSERVSVLKDLSLATGFLNPTSVEYTFVTPVMNVLGYDIIVFDFGGNDDGLSLTINGTMLSIAASPNSDGINSGRGDVNSNNGYNNTPAIDRFNVPSSVSTVAQLESATLTAAQTGTNNGTAFAYLFELGDFGIALGDSISVATFTDPGPGGTTANDADIFLIAGLPGVVPEPASLALLALGGLALVSRRRTA